MGFVLRHVKQSFSRARKLCANVRAFSAKPGAPGRSLLVYCALGFVLWMFPVFNILHVESAAAVALTGFFAAGLSALQSPILSATPGRILGSQVSALLLPWSMLTVTLLWTPNCGYLQGLFFFLLFPIVSVVFGVGVAYLVGAFRWRWKKTLFAGIGAGIVLLAPLYDLGLHPQFYVYNHVFGGVLGPIYDEQLSVRPGLLWFRALTLLWALLCFALGTRLRLRSSGGRGGAGNASAGWLGDPRLPAVCALLIGSCYLFAAPLGINTPAWYIQRELGAVYRTENFDIYYHPATLSASDLQFIAEDHEYQYARLAGQLRLRVGSRIESYLYPDPDARARLTGSRYTNVAPVWLKTPQSHVLLAAYENVFPHELAHVFSREFGLPLLKASLQVGLVEGLAVALEPPDGLPSAHEQVAAAALAGVGYENREQIDLASDLAATLSPSGFWTGRGAVSYTTMGSFIKFLLDTYGPEPLKRVYALGDFQHVYGKPVARLAEAWQAFLFAQPIIARATGELVNRRFSALSLFEKRCPHYVPRFVRSYEAGMEDLAKGDTSKALKRFDSALRLQPRFIAALSAWGQIKLARQCPEEVIARLDTLEYDFPSAAIEATLGDAFAVLGRPDSARAHYEAAIDALPLYACDARSRVALRLLVADRSEISRILVSGASFEDQAQALAPFAQGSPAVKMLYALKLAEAGRRREAADALQKAPVEAALLPPSQKLSLIQQRLVWLGRFYHRSGDLAGAAFWGNQSSQSFLENGDLNRAAEMDDFARKMIWLQQSMDQRTQ